MTSTVRRSWTATPRSPIAPASVAVAARKAEAEMAVGFFGSQYERATPGARDDVRAMPDAAADLAHDGEPVGVGSVGSCDVATVLGKRPQSLSPARDSLLKKGLIHSGERGRIASPSHSSAGT